MSEVQFVDEFDVCPELRPVKYEIPPHHALGWPGEEPVVAHYTCKAMRAGKNCVRFDKAIAPLHIDGGRCVLAKIGRK